jgi:hypothetical protein
MYPKTTIVLEISELLLPATVRLLRLDNIIVLAAYGYWCNMHIVQCNMHVHIAIFFFNMVLVTKSF